MRIAENSSRFSLRVMEAMRLLQRREDRLLPTSTAEDIVDYIQATYHDDGDLYAQVRTTLKQVCSQGLVLRQTERNSRCRRKLCLAWDTIAFQGNCKTVYLARRPCIYRPVSFTVQLLTVTLPSVRFTWWTIKSFPVNEI